MSFVSTPYVNAQIPRAESREYWTTRQDFRPLTRKQLDLMAQDIEERIELRKIGESIDMQ